MNKVIFIRLKSLAVLATPKKLSRPIRIDKVWDHLSRRKVVYSQARYHSQICSRLTRIVQGDRNGRLRRSRYLLLGPVGFRRDHQRDHRQQLGYQEKV